MKQIPDNISREHQAYLGRIKRKTTFVTFMRYAILVLFLIVWELAAQAGVIDPFIASSPSRVAATIARLYTNGDLFMHIGLTLFETVVGFYWARSSARSSPYFFGGAKRFRASLILTS